MPEDLKIKDKTVLNTFAGAPDVLSTSHYTLVHQKPKPYTPQAYTQILQDFNIPNVEVYQLVIITKDQIK